MQVARWITTSWPTRWKERNGSASSLWRLDGSNNSPWQGPYYTARQALAETLYGITGC